MTSPIITLSSKGTIGQALQLMRINQVKRIPITDNVSIIGMVTQRTLADAVRTSVIEATFRNYRAAIREHYKPILGNLGFTLQFAGILMIAPTYLGTALGETASTTGIFLAAVHMLGAGFILNAYGEKRPLNLRQASILIISSFLVLSLFGTIPYMYVNPFWEGIDPLSLFVNSFFESASGFTTTGLSVIAEPENLTQTLGFYRSYTQWIGGLSFIYLVMTLFYPERKLSAMKSVLGAGMLQFKQLLVTVGVIFSAYTAGLVLYLIFADAGDGGGATTADNINTVSLIFSTVTGGGFIPRSDMVAPGDLEVLSALVVGMIISALPFAFHYSLFSKEARTKRLTAEVAAFFLLMGLSVPVFAILVAGVDGLQQPETAAGGGSGWTASAFHVISASTNSGFQYLDIQSLQLDAKLQLIVLMLIGGTAFSTAGGIKVARVLVLFQRLLLRKGATTDTPSSISILSNPYRRSSFDSANNSAKSQKEQQQPLLPAGRQKQDNAANAEEKKKTTSRASAESLTERLFSDRLLRESTIIIASFIIISIVTGSVLSYTSGSRFEDGFFEAVSALTTTGMSVGVTSMDLDLFSKLMLAANMIVGRFEVIAVLYIFFEALRR